MINETYEIPNVNKTYNCPECTNTVSCLIWKSDGVENNNSFKCEKCWENDLIYSVITKRIEKLIRK